MTLASGLFTQTTQCRLYDISHFQSEQIGKTGLQFQIIVDTASPQRSHLQANDDCRFIFFLSSPLSFW